MSKIWSVLKRELKTYLYTPLAYALAAVFLVIGGYFFSIILLQSQLADLRPFFGNMGLITAFLAPVLTMRLLADEARQGTGELLFTSPLTITQAVVGKYLASVGVVILILAVTLFYPGLLEYYGNPDWGPVAAGYLGFVLMVGVFLAVGTFTSSLTDSQLIAGALGFALLLGLWVIGWAADAVAGPVGEVLSELSVPQHFLDFRKGIIDTEHIVFYLSLIAGFLFLAIQVMMRKTWNVRGHRLVRGGSTAVLSVAVIGILVLTNVLGARFSARWDLTATGEFTLSDQTQSVLADLDQDVRAIAFFAGDSAIGAEVETLLVEYDNASPRFSYEMVDPERNPARAKEYDVTSSAVVVLEVGTQHRQISAANLFSMGTQPDMSQFEFRGEEAITRGLVEMTQSLGTRVYFITGHGGPSLYDDYTSLRTYLGGEGFYLTEWNLAKKGELPEDADVAILAGPQADLSTEERRALETYLEEGGTLMALVDPVPSQQGFPQLTDLLADVGVVLHDDVVVDPTRNYFGQQLNPIPRYEYHKLTEKLIERELAVMFPRARSMEVAEELPQGLVAERLLATSGDAWGETNFEETPTKDPEDHEGPLALGAVVSREIDDEEADEGEAGEGEATEAESPGEEEETPTEPVAVVLGNSYFALNDVVGFQGNRDLFLNSVNWLAGREALISIRPKPPVMREVMLTTTDRRVILYSSVFGVPLIVLALGAWVWLRRRAR